MASKKKSVPRKRKHPKSRRSRSAKPHSGSLRRFLKAFSASAVAAFSIASCALNPQWQPDVNFDVDLALQSVLARLGQSGADTSAPVQAAEQGYVQTRFAGCPEFFPQGRPPVVPAAPALRELCFSSFALLHSGRTKTPVFVAERLDRRSLTQARNIARTDRFYAEARLPRAERAELEDYRGSGYSRGHMAPAGNMASATSMEQSFSLANMVPQDQTQNAGPWNRVEQDTRKYVMRAQGDVFVFTGPVYGPSPATLGAGSVAVPDYLFKLVYDPATGKSWVHWQQNDPDARAGRPIDYAEFVRRTGLHLLPSATN